MADREALAELLSRSRHPIRWEYRATSNIQAEDYAQADALIASGMLAPEMVTEWGVRAPEGTVVAKGSEEMARHRLASDTEYWSLVSRETYATPWTDFSPETTAPAPVAHDPRCERRFWHTPSESPCTWRERTCVERWPEAASGEYDPHCCRFPKSCSVDDVEIPSA